MLGLVVTLGEHTALSLDLSKSGGFEMKCFLFLLSAAFILSTVQIVSATLSGAEAHASKRKHTHQKAKRRTYRINPKRLDPRRRNDTSGRYDGYPGWAAEAFTRHIDD